MNLNDVKVWWRSKSMNGGFGLLAMALSVLAGISVSGADLSFLWNQVPVIIGSIGILIVRVKDYSNALNGAGWISLILALIGAGSGTLPQDILSQWHLVETQLASLVQVVLTIFAGFGLHLSEKAIAKRAI